MELAAFSKNLLNTIDSGLRIQPDRRLQSCSEVLKQIIDTKQSPTKNSPIPQRNIRPREEELVSRQVATDKAAGNPDILEHTRLGFGPHHGKTWADVVRQDPGFVNKWLRNLRPSKKRTALVAALKEAMGSNVERWRTGVPVPRKESGTIPHYESFRPDPRLTDVSVPWEEAGTVPDNRSFGSGSRLSKLPVPWTESGDRSDFFAEYVTVGAIPGVLLDSFSQSNADQGWVNRNTSPTNHHAQSQTKALSKALSQTVFLQRRDRPGESSEVAHFAASLIEKLLTRGRTPLPTLGIEREALALCGLSDLVR